MATESNMHSAIIRQEVDPRTTGANQAEVEEFQDALWDKCAGLSMPIPRIGDKIFYFPQGHIEQVTAFTIDEPVPDHAHAFFAFNVPPMILCKVVDIHRKVGADIDDLYADITLLPQREQKSPNLEVVAGPQPQRIKVYSFCKKLTASDINIHGGLTIPKKAAEECLPPLDMSIGSQDLVTKDLHGVEWHFTHAFRGKPKRHMFTIGWSIFVAEKRLEIGDSFIFIRRETGELGVGVRRAHRGEPIVLSPLMSRYSMELGILGTDSHAMSKHANITIYYRPKKIHSEFLIPQDHYVTSVETQYRVGMRFRMKGEAQEEDKPEKRFTGRIVGTEDLDPIRWPGSKWRCLKVQWEDQATAAVCPNRISPWNIEPVATLPTVPRSKRAHASSLASSGDASFVSRSRPCLELNDHPLPGFSRATNSNAGTSKIPDAHLSSRSCELHELISHEPTPVTTAVTLPTGSGTSTCRIFGVDLVRSSDVASPSRRKTDEQLQAHHHHVPLQLVSSRIRQSLQPSDSNDCNRTSTKVQKYGCALVRSVELQRFDQFDGLIHELDHMFEFEGKLTDPRSEWCLIFKDSEGDVMMLRDYPWREIRSMVQKILLCPKEAIHKIDPSFL